MAAPGGGRLFQAAMAALVLDLAAVIIAGVLLPRGVALAAKA